MEGMKKKKEFWNTIQVIFAGIGSRLDWFLGGSHGLLHTLIAFFAVDYNTVVTIIGVTCAMSGQEDIHAQSRIVTPSASAQTITPETDYNYLSQR